MAENAHDLVVLIDERSDGSEVKYVDVGRQQSTDEQVKELVELKIKQQASEARRRQRRRGR